MTLNNSNQAAITERRQKVARLRLRGLTQREICAALGDGPNGKPWSLGIINRDLQTIIAEWKAAAVADIAEHKARVLAELHEAKRAAWKAADLANLLRALKQESDLLGLNEPIAQDTTIRIIDDTDWRSTDN